MGLRRILGAGVLAGITLVASAACAKVDLMDTWPAMAEPTGWMPEAGVCTDTYSETSPRGGYKPVECDQEHGYETVHIGTFTGNAAAAAKAPEPGSAELAAAWTECDAKTTDYVGAPWRDGNLWIAVSVPSPGGWEGGARWFRCEVATTGHRIGDLTKTDQSVNGVLTAETDLRRGCYQNPKDEDKPWVPVKCSEVHNTEYVGSFIATDTWEGLQANSAGAHQKCRSLIAGYVGVPDDGKMKYRTGSSYTFPSKQDWEAGDHGVRCHLWLGDKKLTSSLKGGGTKALPINYA